MLSQSFAGSAIAQSLNSDFEGALVDLDAALAIRPDARTVAIKAITLATRDDAEFRDGAEAVEAALLAEKLVKDAPDLLTLSAIVVAHAEAGDFPTAIRCQRQFIARLLSDERKMAEHDLATLEAGDVFHNAPW